MQCGTAWLSSACVRGGHEGLHCCVVWHFAVDACFERGPMEFTQTVHLSLGHACQHAEFAFPPNPHTGCLLSLPASSCLLQGLAGPVKDLKPTHLVVNSGLWGSTNQLSTWPAIVEAGKQAVAAQGGQVIWRTTTANRGGPKLLVRP